MNAEAVPVYENVAFIGAGVMGRPMIRNLLRAKVPVKVFDVAPEVRRSVAQEGIAVVDSLADAVAGSCIVVTMLPETSHVREVVLTKDGLLEHLASGSLLIEMSTISASTEIELGGMLGDRNIAMIDAPVSGGVVGAINGTLSIMVGGSEDAFTRAMPILQCVGSNIVHAGGLGMGQVFKMCNQLMVASHIQAMCEAFALARAYGADLAKLRDVLRCGAAGSWMLDNLGPAVLAKDDTAGFRIDLQLKDLKLAAEAAFDRGVPLPGLALATTLYLEARAHGEGHNGNQGLFRTFDRMTNQTVSSCVSANASGSAA
jgi:2-hydroxy-3-oxopropionate reductase